MAYREANWSAAARTPDSSSAGRTSTTARGAKRRRWGDVRALVEYQGRRAEATIEPLSEHLEPTAPARPELRRGVQACLSRSPLVPIPDATKALVKEWLDFLKSTGNTSIGHHSRRRPDGRDSIASCMSIRRRLHAASRWLQSAGSSCAKTLTLPLYYTGLEDTAAFARRKAPKRIPHRSSVQRLHPGRGPGTWIRGLCG